MSDSVRHSLIWATCIALCIVSFSWAAVYRPPSPPMTALERCATSPTARETPFCIKLVEMSR